MSGAFEDPELEKFKWMAILAIIVAFVMAFGIGANDVAVRVYSSLSSCTQRALFGLLVLHFA
jgi:phosphate/sulfate permease